MTEGEIPIVGAGIAGLTMALCLARAGRASVIFEQAERLTEVGAGLQLSPNATRILLALGRGDALDRVMHRPHAIDLCSGTTLARLAAIPLGASAESRWGAPYGVIHRADLQAVLLAAVEAEPLCRLVLDHRSGDGERFDAPVTIAADGVWSARRTTVPGTATPAYTGQVAWRFLVEAEKVAGLMSAANVTAFLGPGSHLVGYPVRGGSHVNLVAITAGRDPGRSWSTEGNARDRAELVERFARWHGDIRHLLSRPARLTYWPIYALADGRYFDDRATVLIGDAAHAMPPYAAQGAALAIEDAWELALALTGRPSDLPSAIRGWETRRRARAARVRSRAAFNHFAYHARGPIRLWRNLVLSLKGPQGLAADLDWLYGYRAPGSG
jgi:salicylate hydroxylase